MASLLVRGFALGFLVAASPGPIFFLCFRRTLLRGWRVGLLSGLGVATVDAFYAAVAVFGVAALAAVLIGAGRWLVPIGGAALVVLGVRSILEQPAATDVSGTAVSGRGLASAYLSTVGLTFANPATIVSFAALAATLGAGLTGGFMRPAAVVVGVFVGSACWWAVLSTLASALRPRMTPFAARAIGVGSGVAIAGLGALAIAAAIGR